MILKFHAQTPVIKGYNRSCIYDLARGDHNFISNSVVDTLHALENEHRSVIEQVLSYEELQWLNYLEENEYCFYIPRQFIDCFPKIVFESQVPSIITNAIIDYDFQHHNNILNLKNLENINCKNLVIRILNCDDLDELFLRIKTNITNLTFHSIELVIINTIINNRDFKKFKAKVLRETDLIIDVNRVNNRTLKEDRFFRPNFIIDIQVFTEALTHNTYFNRKLYIDIQGYLKNGIEVSKPLANINSHENTFAILNTVRGSKIKKLWNANKDKIDVCRDCEFRYMCIDNRVPQPKDNGYFYYEKECSYNPYISKWSGDIDFHTLGEIGVISNKSLFSIDTEKVQQIHKRIWIDA